MADNVEELISMAREEFADLTPPEETFLRANAEGRVPNFYVGPEEDNDPANADQWGPDRTIRADCIRWLCVTAKARPLIIGNRLRAMGAKIEGELQLDYSTIDFVLAFRCCLFTGKISFEGTSLLSLDFWCAHVKSIYAAQMKASGSVHFWNGFVAVGMVNLDSARISGNLICDRSRFIFKLRPDDVQFPENPHEAFRAAGLRVQGLVSFAGSYVEGAVCLYQAVIDGNLSCDGSRFMNKGRNALLATGAKIGGALFLARTFFASGEVNLEFTEIGGSLNCEGGFFLHCSQTAQLTALHLECSNIGGSVYLTNWFVAIGLVNLHNANIRAHLDCKGGHFVNLGGCAILGNHARISNGVLLRNGFSAEGEVRLFAATIGGNLECTGGQFFNLSGNALDAERVDVAGHLLLQKSFRAQGTVNLTGATIRGSLECSGGHFVKPSGNALDAERVDVGRHLLLKDSFIAEGTVSLIGAKVAGNLQCSAGRFSNPKGVAINADGARVNGFVFLDKKFEAQGQVRLFRISIGFGLDCQEAKFLNEAQDAIFAPNAKVGGSVLFCNDFVANGKVTLFAAKIRGSLVCTACQFLNEGRDALFATGAEIGDYVNLNIGFVSRGSVILDAVTIGKDLNCEGGHFHNPEGIALSAQPAKISGNARMVQGFKACGALNFYRAKVDGALSVFDIYWKDRITIFGLVSATVATLEQSIDGWPKEGTLLLNGFTYDSLGHAFPRKLCVEWLRLQAKEHFSLQPYEQLAKVLKASGYETEATEVLIAKQDDLRRYGDLGWWAKFANCVLGFSIGHGYRPHLAFYGMLLFLLLGTVVFQAGYSCQLLTRSNNLANVPIARAEYPKFQAFVYSLDAFLPIVDLNQKGYWLPNANHGDIVIPGVRLRWGGLLRIYYWVHIIFGWILTTLWVAGFTGIIRRRN